MIKPEIKIWSRGDIKMDIEILRTCFEIYRQNMPHTWDASMKLNLNNAHVLLTANVENQIVGFETLEMERQNQVGLTAVMVEPKLHRLGIGAKLFETVVENSKNYETILSMHEIENTESKKWHNKMGFAPDKNPCYFETRVYSIDPTKQKTDLIFEKSH